MRTSETLRWIRSFVLILVVTGATGAVSCGSGRSGAAGAGGGMDAGEARGSASGSGQVGGGRAAGDGPIGAGTAWVIIGDDTVRAEIAKTEAERQKGLMNRDEVAPGTGMLFVFDDEEIRTFWMQNTYVALDVAFIGSGMVIGDIQQMEPETTDFHEGKVPAMFALEVPKGWFAEHGVRVGDMVDIRFGG